MLTNTKKPHSFPPRGLRHRVTADRLNAANDPIGRLIEENRRLENRLAALERKVRSSDPSHTMRVFRIIAINQITSVRWQYQVSQVILTNPNEVTNNGGSVRWNVWENGWKGHAYNMMEHNNDGEGVQGHGVDIDGSAYPNTFTMQPVPIGTIVAGWIFERQNFVDIGVSHGIARPTNEVWFCIPNADDGTCDDD